MAELEHLVERCREGDALAWEALVRRTQARVYGLACHYLRSPEDAREVAQDAYVKFYTKLERFDGTNVLGWLLQITRNSCLDQLRRSRVRPVAASIPEDDDLAMKSGADDPEDAWLRSTRQRLVRRAIDRLSERNREMVLLKEIEGLAVSQIAELLGIPLGTAKTRAHRARLELARRVLEIDPAYVGEGGKP